MKLLPQALVGIALSMVITSADADILLSPGQPPETLPGVPIALQGGGIPPSPDVFTINGRVGSGAQFPQFTSSSPIGPSGNVFAPTTPEPLTDFTISIPAPPPGFFFTSFIFKVEKPTADGGLVTVTSNPGTADEQISEKLAETDQQMYTAQAINGEVFQSLRVELSVPVADIATLKFGGTGGLDSFIPVPGPVVGAGLPGLIAALGGLIAMARRRRNQLA